MREEPPTSPLFLEGCLSTFGIPEDSASVANLTEGRRETLLGNPELQEGGTFQTAPFPRSGTRWQESEVATRGRPRPAESILLSPFSRVNSVRPHSLQLQAPLSVGFCRQEYWSGLPFPSPGDLPYPGIEPVSLTSPALAGRFFTTTHTWGKLGSICRKPGRLLYERSCEG